MPVITLLDGSNKQFPEPVTVRAIAESIGPGLAKVALAGKVGDRVVDLSYLVDQDVDLQIVTAKDPAGLDILRHSSAHLLAHAVKNLFPDAQVTIGPVIENGFYYDFAFERAFTLDDLVLIEKEMARIVKADHALERVELTRQEAIDLFNDMGEEYKVQIIKDLGEDETLTAYRQGDFIDLCRGPHVPSTGKLPAFKLTSVAGAYWRGDSNNEMLQRIYGTAFADKKSLKAYLHQLEEAEKRDHRKLAAKMDLYHMQQEAPGLVFWHPNGWTLVEVIRSYLRARLLDDGYREINTPQMVDTVLWEQSGHREKFGDDMFIVPTENREYAIKPMSCPCHVQVFKQGVTSYRDLPIRFSEFGCCHRNEPSGTLHGLMRLRGFVQDDGHIFCTSEQIQAEVTAFINQLHEVYRDFGFTEIIHKLSTRPEKRIGSDAVWDKSEKALADALDSQSVDWDELPGEGAFYGPKIEFSLKDCLGRIWQCGTVQVDFSMPERLGAHYIAEDGAKHPPVMIHRAILGSIERFIAILVENYAGHLPLWLAPIQVIVTGIGEKQADYVAKVTNKLKKDGFRVHSDLRNEKIGFKIREHTIARVPYLVVLGEREVEQETISARTAQGDRLDGLSLDAFIDQLRSNFKQLGDKD